MVNTMTESEIHKKIEQYRVSDAPVPIKEAAIEALEAKLLTNDSKAKQQYIESLPELSDVNSSY